MSIANINGTEIWYSVQGEGPPLLLLPGLGLDHNYYRFGEPLLRKYFTTILVDPRGIGQSRKDSPTDVHYCAELWADDFAALIDELQLGKTHVLGSSLGGAMAQSMALRHQDKLASLIAIGSFSELDKAMQINFELRKKLIRKLGMGEEIADFMGLSTMTREFIDTAAGMAVMTVNQATVRSNSPEHYTAFIDSVLEWGRKLPGQEKTPLMTQSLAQIKLPTLVLAGDNDYFIPASFSKIIAENIPGAEYAEITSGGHIPFIEKPEETCEQVVSFLNQLRP